MLQVSLVLGLGMVVGNTCQTAEFRPVATTHQRALKRRARVRLGSYLHALRAMLGPFWSEDAVISLIADLYPVGDAEANPPWVVPRLSHQAIPLYSSEDCGPSDSFKF